MLPFNHQAALETIRREAATLAVVRKLKASDGSFLWQPGLAAGQPSTKS